jgi:hypothetical protein
MMMIWGRGKEVVGVRCGIEAIVVADGSILLLV